MFNRWFGASRDRDLERRIGRFRAAVQQVDASLDDEHFDALRNLQAELDLRDEDVELELEILDALRDVAVLERTIAVSGLPILETTHKILGNDLCHFAAPASAVTSDESHSGKLFLTNRRVVFLGSGVRTAAWSSIASVQEDARDILFVPVSRGTAHRYRLNSFRDAKRAGAMAARLLTR